MGGGEWVDDSVERHDGTPLQTLDVLYVFCALLVGSVERHVDMKVPPPRGNPCLRVSRVHDGLDRILLALCAVLLPL